MTNTNFNGHEVWIRSKISNGWKIILVIKNKKLKWGGVVTYQMEIFKSKKS